MRKEERIASTPVTSPQALKVEETKPRFDPARMRPNPGEKRNFGTKTLATRSSEERVTDYAVNGLFSNARRIAHCARQIINLMRAKDSQTWLFLKEESLPILILCDWGYLKWGHVSKERRGHATADTLLHYMMMP